MVNWIYIIQCENRYIYVGKTIRLYRRMNEHQNGGGSITTGRYSPVCLVGLYKVADNDSFMHHKKSVDRGFYDQDIIYSWGTDDTQYLSIENHITELLMYLRSKENNPDFMFDDGNWEKVRGGKYTRHVEHWEINPTLKMKEETVVDRPCCDCGFPAEVKISKDKNFIYFVCSMKNIWGDFSPGLAYAAPCDFYKVYTDDVYVKKQYEINKNRLKEPWCENLPKEFDRCIKCNEIQYNMIWALGSRRQICYKCFSHKYDELKKEYSLTEYLIRDDY